MKHEILLHSHNYEQDGNVRSAFLKTRATAAGTSKVGFLATGTNLVNTAMKPGKNLQHPFCHSDHCEQRTQACFPSSGLVRKSVPKSLQAGLQNKHGLENGDGAPDSVVGFLLGLSACTALTFLLRQRHRHLGETSWGCEHRVTPYEKHNSKSSGPVLTALQGFLLPPNVTSALRHFGGDNKARCPYCFTQEP